MFLLLSKGIHQIPVVLSISPSIIAQLCCFMYNLILLNSAIHTLFDIFPIYTNVLCNTPARVCEELESIILLVIEHRYLEIYSVVISDEYNLVVSAPKMIGFA